MANSPAQTTKLTSKSQEASLRACISSNDRISSLPDALIHRILSLLSTKQAVATSILSKRWVSLWTFVHTLDLEDSHRCRFYEQDKMKFVHFVYIVLLLNRAGSVEKFLFRFNCDPVCDYLCVNTWICSAILRGFQEVDISVPEVLKKDLMKLPSGLFLMKALKILKLNGGVMVDVPSSVCLPNLKILHLLRVEYANVESIRCFISGCLSLEELHIDVRISPENMILRALYAAKYLELDGNLDFLADRNAFPLFVNLTRLELHGFVSWPLLSLFLESSPELETLVAHNKIGSRLGGPELAQPKPIPTCFLTSLSRASFENFEGSKEEL